MQIDALQLARRVAALPIAQRKILIRRLAEQGIDASSLPIVPAERARPLPVSFAQRGLWLTWRMATDSAAYNMSGVLALSGSLDRDALTRAVHDLSRRHEVLRTVFRVNADGEPEQVIADASPDVLSFHDLSTQPPSMREENAKRVAQAQAELPFDLEAGPVWRLALIKLDDTLHWLAIVAHHIVADGWSEEILVKDLGALYDAHASGKASALLPLPIQFADYAVWQRDWAAAGELDRQLDYWKRQLGSEHLALALPLDRPRPRERGDAGAVHRFTLPGALTARLRTLASSRDASVFMTMLAILKLVLARYCGQSDIRVGTPVANRQRAETLGLVGYLTNVLVLRTEVNLQSDFTALLSNVRTTLLDAQANQDCPFDLLVSELSVEREPGVHPLFQVKCTEQAQMAERGSFGGLDMQLLGAGDTHAHFDLSFDFTVGEGEIECWFTYAVDIFDERTIARFARAFVTLAEQAVASPQVPLGALELGEPASMLVGETSAFAGRSVLELWTQQVAATPQAPAVRDEQAHFSYAELDAQAARLAQALVAQGVGPEVRVALHAERSCAFVLGMLAVLKAGGVYVPLDPALPAERLAYQLADSGARLLLCAQAPAWTPEVPVIELGSITQTPASGAALPRPHPEQAAYVIYTSGSTGQPKGVAVTHGALANYVQGVLARLDLPPEASSMAMVSTVAADLGHTVLFGALCSGRLLHLIPAECAFDPDRFAAVMRQHRVDVLKLVPSHLQALLAAGTPADVLPRHALVLGGEATPWPLLQQIHALAPACRVLNHYGPTETTVGILTQPADQACRDAGTLPVGRPLPNAVAIVLDAGLNPVPPGVAGELYLGGAGVARGYQGRAGLTAERFVPDPRGNGARLYRSGDRVRLLADGSLEFLGRIDDQVKIRGYRVEPREVAAALRAQAGVREAAVIAGQAGDGRAQLFAYVVAQPGMGLDGSALRENLMQALPDYMVPNAVMVLEALPLTANGKLDRKALPAPDGGERQQAYEAPQGEVEEALAAIWAAVLGVERVGRHDNFFALGGDSILSLQIVARAKKRGIKLSPKHLMEKQTVCAVAAAAQKISTHAEAGRSKERERVSGEVALTPVQRWFFEQDMAERHHWNQALLLEVDEPVDVQCMQRALDRLVEHHDALRLRFSEEGGEWRQRYSEEAQPACFTRVDLSNEIDVEAAIVREADAVQCSLNLQHGPLFRVVWMDLGANRSGRLLLVCHHLVIDAVSWRLLLEDLQRLYRGLQAGKESELPAKTASFKRWSQALAEHAQAASTRQTLAYWEALVGTAEPDLPAKHPQGSNTVASAHTLSLELNEERTAQLLGQTAQAYRTQINDLLLAALARTLCEWAGRDSVLVELEGHGREDLFEGVDVSQTAGWFTTLFPVRLAPGTSCIGRSIKSVKEQLRRVPNKGLDYGVLRYLTAEGWGLAQSTQPQVTFNYLGQFDQSFEEAGWRLAKESAGQAKAPSSLRRTWFEISGMVVGGRLRMTWSYSRNLHEPEQVEALMRRYTDHIEALIVHCLREDAGGVTPSDFPLAGLTQAQLDGLPVAPRNIEDIYPLAPMQQGLLLHTLLNPGAGMYLMQDHYRFDSDIDVDAFRYAWERVVERHAALRTGFVWRNGEGENQEAQLQIVHRKVPSPVQFFDWSDLAREQVDARLQQMLQEELAQGFDMASPPLLRLRLIRLGRREYHLVQSFHHILMDAWCRSLLLTDFFAYYDAHRRGGNVVRPQMRPYRDFIGWFLQQDREAARRYWQETLAGVDTVTPLPSKKNGREEADQATVADVFAELMPEQTQQLQRMAQQQQLTVNTIVQGAWALLLARYANQDDVLFGVTVAGRPTDMDGIQETVGLFINTIPLRVKLPSPDSGTPVTDWLRQLLAQNVTMRQHEHLPLAEIQTLSDIARGQALFDSLFVFENAPLDASLDDRAKEFGVSLAGNRTHTNYPITVVVIPGAALKLQLSYDRRLFDEPVVARLLRHFKHVLEQCMQQPHAPLHALPVMTNAERAALLAQGEGARVAYPFERGYAGLFEDQALAHAERAAARCAGKSLRYGELNRQANRLGHALREHGVREDDIVALFAERSLELLTMVLGVFKAGGAYLGLDSKHPAQRIARVLASSRARVVVAAASHVAQLEAALSLLPASSNAPRLLVYEELVAATYPESNPGIRVRPEQAAYVIYTSGSTGEPKGVVVTSQGMLNNQLSKIPVLQLTQNDVVAQTASQSFDISVWQLLAGLLCGACVDIVPDEIAHDPSALLKHVNEAGITVLESVPSLIQGMLAAEPIALPTLRWMLPTGEATSVALARAWFERYPGIPLVNAYGPAECADDVALHMLVSAGGEGGKGDELQLHLPIGRPTDNTRLYIVDANLELLPPGMPGELVVAGVGVGRGYLHQPGLTAERFLPDPLAATPGARLYRTGDIARYRDDGSLEYLGRIDSQVKIRGFRIELGEIEAQLAKIAEIRQAVVAVREDVRGDRRLVGYVVPKDTALVRAEAAELALYRELLRTHLLQALPEYMVPGVWVLLERLPLTPNGKIDRKALPAPDLAQGQRDYEAPQGEMEEALAAIWAAVLGVERVGRNDNFFELGGHSLLVMRIVARVQSEMRIDVPINDLFETQTLAQFAARLASRRPQAGEDALLEIDAFMNSLETI